MNVVSESESEYCRVYFFDLLNDKQQQSILQSACDDKVQSGGLGLGLGFRLG